MRVLAGGYVAVLTLPGMVWTIVGVVIAVALGLTGFLAGRPIARMIPQSLRSPPHGAVRITELLSPADFQFFLLRERDQGFILLTS
jgi:hypothetical protein